MVGVRVAEFALLRWPDAVDYDLVAVVETDMCGVDAIQYLLGCTYGKGNLIHKDFGKMAFNMFNRRTAEGVRLLLRPDVRSDMDDEIGMLSKLIDDGRASDEQQRRYKELRRMLEERFLQAPLEDMFVVGEPAMRPPRPAQILCSITCENCGEQTMESRTRRYAGKTLCIPCFDAVEQKV